MDRIEFLRSEILHHPERTYAARTPFADPKTIPFSGGSVYMRRARAVAWMFDHSPVYIADRELIVGTRTLLRAKEGNEDGHDVREYLPGIAMPSYYTKEDEDYFGCRYESASSSHYTADYGILLQSGIGGFLKRAKERKQDVLQELSVIEQQYPEAARVKSTLEPSKKVDLPGELVRSIRKKRTQVEFYDAFILCYEAVSRFILRYAELAGRMAKEETDPERARELAAIRDVCTHISYEKPQSFWEAVQLYWFGHLSVILEIQEFVNFGRTDENLLPFLGDTPRDWAEELLACLLLKMSDQAYINSSYYGNYGGQITMTLGGITPDGRNAFSKVTDLILRAVGRTRMTEPLLSFRIHSKNPPEFLEKVCALSQSGHNAIGIYNDDLYLDSLKARGIPERLANNYGFGLCQDVSVPGSDSNSLWQIYCPIFTLLDLVREYAGRPEEEIQGLSFEDFLTEFESRADAVIRKETGDCYIMQEAFVQFREGDPDVFIEGVKTGKFPGHIFWQTITTPLFILDGVFHGLLDAGVDIELEGYELKTQGYHIFTPVVTGNSLVAIKYAIFDQKICTMKDLQNALDTDFAGTEGEKLRQKLFRAPKWGNDDDYADGVFLEFFHHVLRTVQQQKTYEGGVWLSGLHQPHPVTSGQGIGATPDGRKAGTPLSVTLTPAHGTIRNGPLAALRSSAKFDHKLINWNYCFMLNYSSGLFSEDPHLLRDMIKTYFSLGGMQHQPNICSVEELRDAQVHPENYPDLIVRLWGISVRFIDLSRELQDEVLARFA